MFQLFDFVVQLMLLLLLLILLMYLELVGQPVKLVLVLDQLLNDKIVKLVLLPNIILMNRLMHVVGLNVQLNRVYQLLNTKDLYSKPKFDLKKNKLIFEKTKLIIFFLVFFFSLFGWFERAVKQKQ